LQEQLLQLRQLRQSVAAAQAPEPVPSTEMNTADHPRLKELRAELIERNAAWQQRSDRLQSQLNALEKLLHETPLCQPVEAATPPPPPPSEQSGNAPATGESLPTAENAMSVPLLRPGPEPAEPVPSPAVSSPAIPPALVEAIAVTDQPVDRLGLANNLYATGEYTLALQIYERMDAQKLTTKDEEWVAFQIANCQRHLGNKADAERGYRIVTANRQEGQCSQDAQWWLETNDRLVRFRKRLDQLQQTLDSFGDESRASANSL
jgi:tetratricopeptide (TPR) repeat protein